MSTSLLHKASELTTSKGGVSLESKERPGPRCLMSWLLETECAHCLGHELDFEPGDL